MPGGSQLRRARRAHRKGTLLRVGFGFARLYGNNVYFRAQYVIQQQIGAHVLRFGRYHGGEIQYRLNAQTAAGRGRFHGVIGLRRAIGDGVRHAAGSRLAQQIFQFSDLVASEKIHAGKVVALDVDIDAQMRRQSVQTLQRRRKEAEIRPGKPGQHGAGLLNGRLHENAS